MTPEERWAVQKGIQYKKVYDDPIDNYIAMREKTKKQVEEILQREREQKEKKEFEKQLQKQVEELVEQAIDKALKDIFK